jgi:hypothetical protein
MGSLLQDAVEMKKQGAVRADLRAAALAGMAFQLEKQGDRGRKAILDAIEKGVEQLEGRLAGRTSATFGTGSTMQAAKELAELRAKARGPNWLQYLAPLLQPLGAVTTGLGLFGGAKIVESWGKGGVEDEVVKRYQSEFLSTGRSADQWAQSGYENRVRALFRDLHQIAPDLASKAPAALSAIRPVAQRPHMPNFTEAEVKDLVQTQQSMRAMKPSGAAAVENVTTLFRLTPDYSDVISQMSESGVV